MSVTPPLTFGYALLVVKGLIAVLAPRKAIVLATSAWRLGFENVGDLEPREWYVEVTRVAGVGMVAAGMAGLLLTGENDDAAAEIGDDPTSGDDGPVRVDVD